MSVSDELLLKLVYQEENKKALSEATAQLDKMTEAEKELVKQNAALKDSGDKAAAGFSKMQAGIVALSAGMQIAGQVVQKFEQAWAFAKSGAQIELNQIRFDRLANSIGTTADSLTGDLADASQGLLSDSEQIAVGTNLMSIGIAKTHDQVVRLSAVSAGLGMDMGQLVLTLTNQSTMRFDQLGVSVDGFDARLQKLKDTGMDVNDAFTEAFLQQAEEQIIRLGGVADTTYGKMQKFEAQLKNLGDEAKVLAADALAPLLDANERHRLALDESADAVDRLAAAEENDKGVIIGLTFQQSGLIDKLKEQIRLEELSAESFRATVPAVQSLFNEFSPLFEQLKIAQTFKPLTDILFPDKLSKADRATDLSSLSPEKQAEASKAYSDYQDKLVSIEDKGSADREKIVADALETLDKLEAEHGQKRADIIEKFAADEASRLSDMHDKRIEIITSYAEAEQQITDKQNKDRLRLAQSYGIEVQRMEEDHQRSMARLSEDHGRRISKLAESRDALGLEDEQENYEIERRRAEEDYQVSAERKDADYARQLADQSAAFEEQRQAAADNEQKQLAALADQFAKQETKYQETYNKQLTDLDKATQEQRFAIYTAEQKKLRELDTALEQERATTETAWTQWRNEHDLFFAGERAAYDAYLKYTHDQLQAYLGGGATPTVEGGAPTTGAPFRAMGGRVDPFGSYIVGENGPERLHMGSQGGYVEPRGGNVFKVSINVAGTNATTSQIEAAVYSGIAKVMQAAMR